MLPEHFIELSQPSRGQLEVALSLPTFAAAPTLSSRCAAQQSCFAASSGTKSLRAALRPPSSWPSKVLDVRHRDVLLPAAAPEAAVQGAAGPALATIASLAAICAGSHGRPGWLRRKRRRGSASSPRPRLTSLRAETVLTSQLVPTWPTEDEALLPGGRAGPLAPAAPRGVIEILKSGELEELSAAEAGACQVYEALSKDDRRMITKRARSLNLDSYLRGDGALVVYTRTNQLVYGVVPYSWEELGLHPTLISALRKWTPEPITKPTHIQADALRKLLAGRDLVIQAETGSGKTLAYMLPAAQKAVEWAEEKVLGEMQEELEEELEEDEAAADGRYVVQKAACYRVEHPVGPEGLRCVSRPDDMAPPLPLTFFAGDEFMAKGVDGSPFSVQYVELADGRGWVPWDRQSPRYRLALSALEFRVGQRVEAKVQMKYGSGDVIKKGMCGVIERVVPLVGVRWDGMTGVKAVRAPRAALRDEPKHTTGKGLWARAAPNFIFITATRELCEQVATTARQLGSLLPEEVRDEWTVATALGDPPGPRTGKEQWPFPMGENRPKVLVATIRFLGYFFHRKHMAFWGNVHYIAYDEVDYLLTAPERRLLYRIKTMLLRSSRNYEDFVTTQQQVAVCSMLPSQGRYSAFLRLRQWMPGALRALPRTALLHKSHPLVPLKWQFVPKNFNQKVKLLVEELKRGSKVVRRKQGKEEYWVKDKTIIFVNMPSTGMELAEALATEHSFGKVGLFVSEIGADARRERLEMFRKGEIMVMVSTDILSRGIDIPDLRCMIQFDFSKNVTNHIGRVGRVSRAGRPGYAINYYDNSLEGHKYLAEAIQYVGDQPLDGLFSRRKGFRKALRENERFRKELEMQNLPLPPHFQGPEKPKRVPLLTSVLEGTEDIRELDDDAAEGDEWYDEDDEDQDGELSLEDDFDNMTAAEKDKAYRDVVESLGGKDFLEGDSLEGSE